MTIQEAKQIRIADYLQSLGYTVKRQDSSLWYKSPLREEAEASFKVNTELNQWYDFGIGRVAISSHWLRNSTAPTTCRICWSASPNRHRICTPSMHHFLLVGNPFQNRCTDICKFQVILSCTIILFCRARNKHRTRQRNVRNCILKTRADHASPSVSRIWRVVYGQPLFKGCVAQGHHPYPTKWRQPTTWYLFEGFMDYLSFLSIRVRNNPQCPD